MKNPRFTSGYRNSVKRRKGFLVLYVGLAVLIVFFVLVSLAPQVSRKLGDLAKKKEQQKSYAQTASIGTAWTSEPSTSSPVSKSVLLIEPQQGLATYTVDQEVIDEVNLINNYRSQNGLAALAADKMLTDAAKWKANDMASNNYFSHTDSLGRDPFTRMASFGYNFNTWKGENLVMGTADPNVAFNLWKNSPGHNANMLNSNYTAIGLYRAYNPNSDGGWYWASEFGGYTEEQVSYVPNPPFSKGDVDCNFTVDSVDALLILRYVAGLATGSYGQCPVNVPYEIYMPQADVDGNGVVNSVDALYVLQYTAGIRSAQTQSLVAPAVDSDGDGMTDQEEAVYSCLNPNAADANLDPDGDKLTNIQEIVLGTNPCVADTDADGFSDYVEFYIGTKPLEACFRLPADDAWPPDFRSNASPTQRDGIVSGIDLLPLKNALGSVKGDVNYNRRADLNADGKITSADVLLFKQYYNQSCN